MVAVTCSGAAPSGVALSNRSFGGGAAMAGATAPAIHVAIAIAPSLKVCIRTALLCLGAARIGRRYSGYPGCGRRWAAPRGWSVTPPRGSPSLA